MTTFTTDIDIANRGLGHLGLGGAKRIAAFTDDTKQASEMSFLYDKMRVVELRRNLWTFAMRKAMLRPVDTNTKLVTFPAYASGTSYSVNGVVVYNNLVYYSLQDTNLGHQPDTSPTYWRVYFGPKTASAFDTTNATSYYAGELVYDSGNVVYLSLLNGNTDTPPTANWRTLTSATLADLNLIYPLGTGPTEQTLTRNIYVLPYGYLRSAPQDPKAGASSFLGAPGGHMYDDWEMDDQYLVSSRSDPILLRFVADIQDVTLMDPMFCEGLGARLAIEGCETITGSTAKLASVEQKYAKFMGEARLVNAIEQGAIQPPEDDYITTRM